MPKSTHTGWTRAALTVLLACVLLGGCSSTSGGGGPEPSTPDTRGSITPSAIPTPALVPLACGEGARAFWLPGPGGSRLEANSVGSGTDAVVFLHEIGRAGMCGFWQYANWLADAHHVRAVLVNRCNYGQTTCRVAPNGDPGIVAETKPAVDWLRKHGATRVTLVGASGGGGDALQAGGVISHIDAVVDLSGGITDSGGDSVTDARRLRVPALFAVAPDDPNCSLDKVRATYRLVPSAPKRMVVVSDRPGIHGWDLLTDNDGAWSPLAGQVANWIHGTLS